MLFNNLLNYVYTCMYMCISGGDCSKFYKISEVLWLDFVNRGVVDKGGEINICKLIN